MAVSVIPETQQTFLGATIVDFSVSLGWNTQSSTLNVRLVEDPANNDSFAPARVGQEFAYVGQPAYFQFGDFRFGGVITSYTKDNSTDGRLFNVILNDPRDILDGIQLVLDAFQLQGNVDQIVLKQEMPNLFNIFDYFETDLFGTYGFGASAVNEAGMYWENLKLGYLSIQERYGPAKFNGANYYVNFDGLPKPPLYYRVPGPGITLLETVSMLCEDSGCDFFTELNLEGDRNVIRFKTVSRTKQPPLGQIKNYVDSRPGESVVSNGVGVEFRNDVTSILLVGGNREDLYFVQSSITDKIRPFFGFDIDGKPITAESFDNDAQVVLNCSSLYDILGTVYYPTTVFELRAALYNMDTWLVAIQQYNQPLATYIGFNPDDLETALEGMREELGKDTTSPSKLLPTNKGTVNAYGSITNNNFEINLNRTYDFIKSIAEDCYGKKFLISLPDVRYKVVPETGETVYEYDIVDTGYLQPGVAQGAIGLLTQNEPVMTDDQGKFYAFARFNNVADKDISLFNPEDVVFQDNGDTLFMKVEVEPNLITPGNSPFSQTSCVITLPSLVTKTTAYTFGDASALGKLLGLADAEIDKYIKMENNNFYAKMPYAIPPNPSEPAMVGIPLRSNVYTYGPWRTPAFAQGGKVRFEQDTSLVPWNYGGYGGMDDYAFAKINGGYTSMMLGETGEVEEVGAPTIPLGDVIKAGGPNVTAINVSIGTDGVKTRYSMRTYTPKFGAFSLQGAAMAKRYTSSLVNTRRKQKELAQQRSSKLIGSYKQGHEFLKNTLDYNKRTQGTPHEGFVGYVDDLDEDKKSTFVASDITNHFVGKFRGNQQKGSFDSEVKKMGAIGMEGLFRPYQTNFEGDTKYLPRFTEPTVSGVGNPNVNDLTPFKEGHDISVILKVDKDGKYEDYTLTGDNAGAIEHFQGIGLKTPIVAVGWGYDTNGAPTPSASPTTFEEGYESNPSKWKAGPIDLRWDEERGVWNAGGNAVRMVKITKRPEYEKAGKAKVMQLNLDSYDRDGKKFKDGTDPQNWYKDTDTEIDVMLFYRYTIIPVGVRAMVTNIGGINYIVSTEQ